MKPDTFAKLITLETLIDAEIGYYLEHHPPLDTFREGMVERIGELVDEIDALDAVTAARVYDAIVDFLTDLPPEDDGIVESTIRFKRAIDHTFERAMEERELVESSTWAFVLDELLEVLADEYHAARRRDGELRPREYLRARLLLNRARDAAERTTRGADAARKAELRSEMDRLAFAVHNRKLKASVIDFMIRPPQRLARRHRPSNLSRIGGFVLGQLLRRQTPSPEPKAT